MHLLCFKRLLRKRNELLSHPEMGMNFKCILLRERSLSKKAPCCMILFIQHFGKGTTIELLNTSAVARAFGKDQGLIGEAPGMFYSSGKLLFDAGMVDA